ncbi:MAG TPA: hypothetical protein VGV65_08190, partial [Nocardioides sp.]|nr:hypothetical protein [Nocardioides sp.]
VADGTDPATCRRESREHPPTLGRDDRPPLGLSTGAGQSDELEEELEEELEDVDELEDEVVEVLDDDEESEVEPDEPEPEPESDDEEDPDAGVADDEVERLSLR